MTQARHEYSARRGQERYDAPTLNFKCGRATFRTVFVRTPFGARKSLN
jgi:hypothetical protein